jgi:MraZ protein
MSIPAKFRRVIEAGDPAWTPDQPMTAKILYGKHLGESLQVLTVEAFDAKIARIMAMPDSDPNKNRLRKLFMGYSEDMTIDKDGRVVLALRLREKLGVVEWLDEMGDDFDPMSLVP